MNEVLTNEKKKKKKRKKRKVGCDLESYTIDVEHLFSNHSPLDMNGWIGPLREGWVIIVVDPVGLKKIYLG